MAYNTIFYDTNVFVDIAYNREGSDSSQAIHGLLLSCRAELWITTPTIATAFYIGENKKNMQYAREALAKVIDYFKVVPQDSIDVMRAFKLPIPDLEDELQYQAALSIKADYVVTRDKIFQNLKLTQPEVVSPETAITRLFK